MQKAQTATAMITEVLLAVIIRSAPRVFNIALRVCMTPLFRHFNFNFGLSGERPCVEYVRSATAVVLLLVFNNDQTERKVHFYLFLILPKK